MSDWISTSEAAKLCGYDDNYIRILIRGGKIKAKKFAIVWMIDKPSLLRYVKEQNERGDKRGRKPFDKA